MIDIVLDNYCERIGETKGSDMWLEHYELEEKKCIIHIGTDIEAIENRHKDANFLWCGKRFNSFKKAVEELCDEGITHETIHIAIYKLEGLAACNALDSIDKNFEITRCI